MKKSLLSIAMCAVMLTVASCGSKNYSPDAAGIETWGKDMQDKFGPDAWYTNLILAYSDGKAVVSVSETDDPASLNMREWAWTAFTGWRQTSDVTLEISGDASPEEFMFQLGKQVDMKLVGSLVEKSKAQLAAEKKIENPRLESVALITPDREDVSAMTIDVALEPENGGTTFRFEYNLAGELLNFDY
jgi:predicted small lipoprotein YifL